MRILLVEDDQATAQSIRLTLKSEGYVVDAAELGEDGLEIGKIYDYDLIILDLILPDIDGYEVLRRLRDARVETPILILSGLTELDNKVKGPWFWCRRLSDQTLPQTGIAGPHPGNYPPFQRTFTIPDQNRGSAG